MNLAELMNHTGRTYGRGPDSTLVHMSPREVQSLQGLAQIHGGNLTTNPHTGLPEAGFLDNILPAVAGIGLSLIPGVGPLAAAGITGAATALTSGSLEKGLAAGLGAYGAAGLGSGLTAAGNLGEAATGAAADLAGAGAGAAQSAAAGASTPAIAPMANIGEQVAANNFMPVADALTPTTDIMSQVAQGVPNTVDMSGLGQLTQAPEMNLMGAGVEPSAQPGMFGQVSDNLGAMGRGLGNLFTDTSDAIDAMGGLGSIGTNAAMAMAPMMLSDEEYEEEDMLDPDRGYIRPYTFHRNRIENAGPGENRFDQYFEEHAPVRPEDYNSYKGYASGGSITPADFFMQFAPFTNGIKSREQFNGLNPFMMEMFNQKPEPKKVMEFTRTAADDGSGRRWKQEYTTREMTDADREQGRTAYEPGLEYDAAGNPKRKPKMNPMMQMMMQAQANRNSGSMYQTQYAEGGHLKGVGDGQSDSIPAMIDGMQPAALSTDEFVVPADVVSALGNGSSDAGAKELHAMMDRIRSKAHGSKKQQRKVSPNLLPA